MVIRIVKNKLSISEFITVIMYKFVVYFTIYLVMKPKMSNVHMEEIKSCPTENVVNFVFIIPSIEFYIIR